MPPQVVRYRIGGPHEPGRFRTHDLPKSEDGQPTLRIFRDACSTRRGQFRPVAWLRLLSPKPPVHLAHDSRLAHTRRPRHHHQAAAPGLQGPSAGSRIDLETIQQSPDDRLVLISDQFRLQPNPRRSWHGLSLPATDPVAGYYLLLRRTRPRLIVCDQSESVGEGPTMQTAPCRVCAPSGDSGPATGASIAT